MTEELNQIIKQRQSQSAGCVQVSRDLQISIPSPDSERVMAIRCADWQRLEKRLSDVTNLPTDFSILYGIFFGFSGSAVLAVIPLSITKDLPPWVLPTSIALAVGAFILGCFIIFFSRIQRTTRRTLMTALLDDVNEIASRFTPGPTQEEGITQNRSDL